MSKLSRAKLKNIIKRFNKGERFTFGRVLIELELTYNNTNELDYVVTEFERNGYSIVKGSAYYFSF